MANGEHSFEIVALPHLEAVYRVARRLSGSEEEAEDLVQETYLKAHKGFSKFELRDFGVKPWLFRILHNTFLNRRVRERRTPKAIDQDTLELMPNAVDPSDGLIGPPEVDYERVDQEVKRAIDLLPADFQTVLLLWATMELSYQEIAVALGVPIGTVMSRLHRARQALAKSLADYAREHRLIVVEDAQS